LSLLTLYRPNFCAACGSKIFRVRWRVWTSRRFCKGCAKQFRKQRWLQPLIVCIALLALGVMMGRATRRPAPPLLIQRNVVTSGGAQNQPAPPVLVVEDVYLCGARTKKGTPCSRRVHGPVRCWQHKGMNAMLPAEKLKIKE
jgi:hypothetical protein